MFPSWRTVMIPEMTRIAIADAQSSMPAAAYATASSAPSRGADQRAERDVLRRPDDEGHHRHNQQDLEGKVRSRLRRRWRPLFRP